MRSTEWRTQRPGAPVPESAFPLRSAEGLLAIDEKCLIVDWNQGAERLTGCSAEKSIGRHCWQVLHGRDESGALRCHPNCAVRAAVLRGRLPPPCDLLCTSGAGPPRWLSVSTIAFDPPRRHRLLVHLLRSIEERKRIDGAVKGFVCALSAPVPTTTATDDPAAGTRSLSRRELEVLSLVASGLRLAAAAERLGISRVTARNHLQRAMGKLRVRSRAEAVAFAFRRGLLPLDPGVDDLA